MTLQWLPGLLAIGALAACTPLTTVPPPAAIADRTTIDERGALAVEVAYRLAGALLEAAVTSGRLKGDAALRADEIDAEAAKAVAVARLAYDAGNADSYSAAVVRAKPLIARLRSLAGTVR